VASLVPFTIDLAAHEGTRLAAVLDALGPHWDPTQIYTHEAKAHQMLYAHLDPTSKPSTTCSSLTGCYPKPPR
jgi:hypothetical protein